MQLKRFLFFDRPVKLKEDIEFPEVLNIEERYVSNQFKARNVRGARNALTGKEGI